jgi:hypothetical protein
LAQSIARVQELIDLSAEAAEAELERLIGLLRAMQPHARAQASHLAREFDLVERYANVARLESLSLPRWRMSAAEAARFAKLAPMVLLPLSKALVAHNPSADWTLRAEVVGGMLQLRFECAAAVPASDALEAALAQARSRLADVHGAQSSVMWAPDQPQLLLSVPFEEDTQASKAHDSEES